MSAAPAVMVGAASASSAILRGMETVLTGIFTLAGAFGGALLAQRHGERLAREARLNSDRDEVRVLLTRLLQLGYRWVGIMQLAVPLYSQFQKDDIYEYVDTDSGVAHRECTSQLVAAFAEARLRIGDEVLLQPFAQAHLLFDAAGEKAMGAVLPSRTRATGDALMHAVASGLGHVGEFREALESLELAAAPLLRTAIAIPAPTRRRWRRDR